MWIPKSIQVFEERVAAPELLPDDPLQVALDALQVFDGQVEERVLAEESLVALDVDELDLLPVAELLGEAVDEAHGLEGLRRLDRDDELVVAASPLSGLLECEHRRRVEGEERLQLGVDPYRHAAIDRRHGEGGVDEEEQPRSRQRKADVRSNQSFRWGHLRARSGSGASTAGALWCSISASYRLQGNPVMERRCSM